MDKAKLASTVKMILTPYAQETPSNAPITSKLAFDDQHGSYAVLQVGWDGSRYIHGALIHVDIIDGKVWIQFDGTETGIADDLLDAGIPHDQIVLGFRPPEVRPYTGFASH